MVMTSRSRTCRKQSIVYGGVVVVKEFPDQLNMQSPSLNGFQ